MNRAVKLECLSENDVLAFLEGQLSMPRRMGVEHHVDECESCRDLVYVALGSSALSGSAAGEWTAGEWTGGDSAGGDSVGGDSAVVRGFGGAAAIALCVDDSASSVDDESRPESASSERITLPPTGGPAVTSASSAVSSASGGSWSRWLRLAVLASVGGVISVLARAYCSGALGG